MADRTYNAVEIDIMDKGWSKCARRLYLHLSCMNPSIVGMFRTPIGQLMDHWEDVYNRQQIIGALDEMHDEGAVSLSDGLENIWIRGHFGLISRRFKSPSIAIRAGKAAARFPDWCDEFYDLYPKTDPGTTVWTGGSEPGFVYVGNWGGNEYKIGRTRNLPARLKAHRNPRNYGPNFHLVASFAVTDSLASEHLAHAAVAGKRIPKSIVNPHTEHFRLAPADIHVIAGALSRYRRDD